MKLVYEQDDELYDVTEGFEFGHGPDTLRVTYCPKPHKPSSSGKVTVEVVGDNLAGAPSGEFFCQVFGMKWIEREDQGWMHPEMELRTVLEAYDDIFGVDLSGLNLADAIAFIRSTTIASFPDNRLEDMMTIKKWLDKQ